MEANTKERVPAKRYWDEFTKGILKQNPLLVLILGTCPSLAVTTSLINGLGMGLAATFVLVCSNIVISALRKVIPDKVRIPCFITVIASFVTILRFILEAYLPSLNDALGIFIPLITVNCIILGRAEAFASKNTIGLSALDGLGMGLGFTLALVVIGGLRELLGNGSIAGYSLPFIGGDNVLQPMLMFVMPPGGFIIFGIVIAMALALSRKFYSKHPDEAVEARTSIGASCDGCGMSSYCAAMESVTGATVEEPVSGKESKEILTETEAKPEAETEADPAEAEAVAEVESEVSGSTEPSGQAADAKADKAADPEL